MIAAWRLAVGSVLAGLLVACAGEESAGPSMFDRLASVSFDPPPDRAQAGDSEATIGRIRERADGTVYIAASARGPVPTGARPAPDGSGIQVSFENAEIRDVAQAILGDILQLPFTIDPAVRGQVTLATNAPVPRETLLGMVETVLRMNNAALVQDSTGGYDIVPIAAALGRVGVAQLGDDQRPLDPGFGITIVRLRHVSALTAIQFVQPIMSSPDDLRVDATNNLILVSGTSQERQAVLDTLAGLDTDWMADKSVGIFPVEATTPEAIIPELEAIFDVRPQSGPEAQLVRFLPMRRLNAVLVVATRRETIERARDWVKRLDQGSTVGVQFYVYQLQHSAATQVAQTLTRALGEVGQTGATPTGPQTTFSAGATGADQGAVAIEDGIPPGIVAEGGGVPLAGSATGGSSTPDELATVKIVPNESNNSLLIRATPDVYRMIEATLRRLDTPPLQVLIDATIAEVTLNDRLRYGVQYFFQSGDVSVGFSATEARRPSPELPGFSFLLNVANSKIVALDALSAVTDVRVVSSPTLVVQDNSEATLKVGDEVPVTTRQSVDTGSTDAPIVNSIQFRETGVILQVKPRISQNDTVSLDVSQEVSNVVEQARDTLTPTIAQRKVQSRVAVRNGQTIVLGGLISERGSRVRSGVPGLADIPVLGWLFSKTDNQTARTELIVFITPRIVRSGEDARAVSEEVRSRLISLRPSSSTRADGARPLPTIRGSAMPAPQPPAAAPVPELAPPRPGPQPLVP